MDDSNRALTEAECWEFLRSQEFGRLAYHLLEEVNIVPLNFAVDGETLLFRTAPGSKLIGVVMNADVAFEADAYDETTARSVVVHGSARLLPEDEAHRAENVPLRPWVDDQKYNVVEIVPTKLTGRQFDLTRPWLHITPPKD